MKRLLFLLILAGCSGQPVVDELGGRHPQDATLRCDVWVKGKCVQWSRTRSLASVRQQP